MEKRVVKKVVRNWNQRKDVEKDENYDGMCLKCCDAGRGNIELLPMLIFYKEWHRDVRYHPICSRYILAT